MNEETYRKKVLGCWLGKAVGGTLGMPYEGRSGPFQLNFYDPVPECMLPNDDLDLQVVWACLLDREEVPRVDRTLFAEGWLNHIGFSWDEYGVCIRNLREGIQPRFCGSYDNWFAHGMGAAIRSELWACLAPGNPQCAAAYAYEDACLDHAGDGIWAEVWLAAMESAAFVNDSVEEIVRIGMEHVPKESILRTAIEDTRRWWEENGDWRSVRRKILSVYGHENFTNVTENMAFTLLALLNGGGDFSRSICTAVNCGKDTDCTAATVGALMGILDPSSIDDSWLKPIGRDLRLSPEIIGLHPPDTLDDFTDMVVTLRTKLQEAPPPIPEPASPPNRVLAARAGRFSVPWFGQGYPMEGAPMLPSPDMHPVTFPGTIGTWTFQELGKGALFLEYDLHIEREISARVFFNTHEPCRVFLNGTYVFGRDGGVMAPSPHRIPLHQSTDCRLTGGTHRLTAVIAEPQQPKTIQWVVGVADRENANQWVTSVFTGAPDEKRKSQAVLI